MIDSMGSVAAGQVEFTTEGAEFFAGAPETFVSPWTPDSNHSSHATVFRHELGVIPKSLMVMFSPDQQTAFPLLWSWSPGGSGNPVTISMDTATVTLQIFSGEPLHGVWNATTGWTTYGDGYWKVVAGA